MAHHSAKYTQEQKDAVVALRLQGLAMVDIASQTGVGIGSVKSFLNKAGITLSSEQRSASTHLRKISPEQELALVAERQNGVTRKVLAAKYGLSEAGIKCVFRKHSVVLSMEVRENNAHTARAAKFAAGYRMAPLSAEVIARRSAAVAARYHSDPELCRRKGEQTKAWWAAQGPTSKYTWEDVASFAQELGMQAFGAGTVDSSQAQLVCFCGNRFEARVYDFLYGKIQSCGCQKSKPQAELVAACQARGLYVDKDNRTALDSGRELDIFLPEKKLAIEYCGLHWHNDRYKGRYYHSSKADECDRLGIRLITVFSDEWILKRRLVLGFIDSVLGIYDKIYGARKLTLCKVPSSAAQQFWEDNHMQGSAATPVCWGLFDADELVAALGCRPSSPERKGAVQDGYWELTRYAVKAGVSVTGGFARLWRAFLRDVSPSAVVSFSDRRWSVGGVYLRHGFVLDRRNRPSYSYFKKGTDAPRWHKGVFRKDQISRRLGPVAEHETEWRAMQRFGYNRIWDCGQDRWIWRSSTPAVV